eukprot:5533298-Amphidinium_carterae.1
MERARGVQNQSCCLVSPASLHALLQNRPVLCSFHRPWGSRAHQRAVSGKDVPMWSASPCDQKTLSCCGLGMWLPKAAAVSSRIPRCSVWELVLDVPNVSELSLASFPSMEVQVSPHVSDVVYGATFPSKESWHSRAIAHGCPVKRAARGNLGV